MTFRVAAALAVFALVIVPLIAHLLRRRPPEEKVFAAVKLVPDTAAADKSRPSIEDRALFALRGLAVLALAVLGATPFVRCSRLSLARNEGASVALAIVLDDSLSMKAKLPGGASRFSRAAEGARQLVASMQQGDAIAVVMAGKPARVALAATTNLEAARAVLARVVPSDRGTELDGAVRVAGELLAGLHQVDKRIVVLSDLADEPGPCCEAPAGASLWAPIVELKGDVDDCGVVRADRSGNRVTVRVACSARARSATGSAKDRKLHIVATQAPEPLAEAPLAMADAVAEVSLALSDAAVERYANARLDAVLTGADDLPDDDGAPVVASGADLRVGIVSDPSADRLPTGGPPLCEQALRALDLGVRVAPLPTVPERREELDDLGLLVVDDAAGFTPAQRKELAGWIERGGVLLLALGPRAAAAPLGSGFSPMLPALLRWQSLSTASRSSSLTAPKGLARTGDGIFSSAFDGLDDLRAKGRVELAIDGNARDLVTVSRWDDGAPFLIERRIGRGLALSLTLPFSSEQSDFGLRPALLALLDYAVGAARDNSGPKRTVVGASWPLGRYRDAQVLWVDRQGQRQPVAVDGDGGKSVTSDAIGLYELTLDGARSVRVAELDERELLATTGDLPGPQASAAHAGAPAKVDASPQVALALLGILAAEIAVRACRRVLERKRS